jgi:hypothetical protein
LQREWESISSGGIQGDCNISKSMGGVKEIYLECCKFFKSGKLILQVFESIKIQGASMWKRNFQFFENFNFEI